jgi:electron transfer flavoprotein alpha subunit
MNVLVFAEQRDGKLKKASLEAMSVGRDLADATGGAAAAVILGQGIASLSEPLGKVGAEKVFVGDDALFAQYSNDAYGLAVGKAAQLFGADALVFSGTAMGRDLAPKVSARLEIGLLSDATAYAVEGGSPVFKRPIYAGKAFATLVPVPGKPFAVTLRPNVFPVGDKAKTPEVLTLDHGVSAGDLKAVVEKIMTAQGELLDVAEADIIVSGGRGMKGPENYKILEELAKELGGAVGASRAAVDAGWIGHEHQVGQTGKVVTPGLYIACGISGAIQHLAGMSSSKVIVAVNKDPEAPIFKVATYGIVGDLFEVVPLLTQAVKELKAKQ